MFEDGPEEGLGECGRVLQVLRLEGFSRPSAHYSQSHHDYHSLPNMTINPIATVAVWLDQVQGYLTPIWSPPSHLVHATPRRF